MSEENVEVLRLVYDEWAKGNMGAGLDLLDPQIVYINRPGLFVTGTCYGLPEMQRWMRGFLKEWNDYEAHATEFIPCGDTVVVAFRQVATGPGSGIPTEMSAFAVWTFRADKVIRLEKMADRREALEAAGLSE
jgi:ketosteroid isomerase-like protein